MDLAIWYYRRKFKMKKYIWSIIIGILIFISFSGCTKHTFIETLWEIQRPDQWAVAIKKSGVSNLFRVDQKLYRSAQPKPGEFKELYALGIRYSLNLQQYHDDQDEIGNLQIEEYRVPISVFTPNYDDLVKSVRFILEADAPVLVHCLKGSDRTGVVVAAYRIVGQNWSKHEAIREMKEGGYGYNKNWTNLFKLINSLDVKQFRYDVSNKKDHK